jgi:hypothetical protein
MRHSINSHPAISIVMLLMTFVLGSAIFLSNSDIKFTIKDDTRTIVLTYLKEGGRIDPAGLPLPETMEIKPEPLDKVRTLRFEESLYFCVITFATIGYGDITPVSRQGRLFITWYAFVSILFTLIGIPYLVANWQARESAVGRKSEAPSANSSICMHEQYRK